MKVRPAYVLYGINIASSLPLPAPRVPAPTEVDVELIYAGRSQVLVAPRERFYRALLGNSADWELRYERRNGEWLSFSYRRAERQLRIAGTDPWEEIFPFLVGPVCGVLLRGNGIAVLHGVGLVWRGQALAILGASGAGKSTLAAALLARGAALLSDDVVALTPRGDGFSVQPGHGGLGLEPDAAARLPLHRPPKPVFPSRPDMTKLQIDVAAHAGGFHSAAAPLSQIYLLDRRDPECLRPTALTLAPRRAAIELMRHVYGADWIGALATPPLASCADLAARFGITRLTRPDDMEALGETAQLLLADCACRFTAQQTAE